MWSLAHYCCFLLHCKWLANSSSRYLLEATILTNGWWNNVGTFRYMSALVSTLFLNFSHLSSTIEFYACALVLFCEQFWLCPLCFGAAVISHHFCILSCSETFHFFFFGKNANHMVILFLWTTHTLCCYTYRYAFSFWFMFCPICAFLVKLVETRSLQCQNFAPFIFCFVISQCLCTMNYFSKHHGSARV